VVHRRQLKGTTFTQWEKNNSTIMIFERGMERERKKGEKGS
jgi:hypothetical protein